MSFQTTVLKTLESIESWMRKADTRFERIEATQDKVITELLDLKTYVHEEVAAKKELAQVKDELSQQIDAIAHQTGLHEDERVTANYRLDSLEGRVDKLEQWPAQA